jgi:hypothetical protein
LGVRFSLTFRVGAIHQAPTAGPGVVLFFTSAVTVTRPFPSFLDHLRLIALNFWRDSSLSADAFAMTKSERYRQHAAQCIRASQHARSPGAKHLLIVMSQRWNELAAQAEHGLLKDQQDEAVARNLLKNG